MPNITHLCSEITMCPDVNFAEMEASWFLLGVGSVGLYSQRFWYMESGNRLRGGCHVETSKPILILCIKYPPIECLQWDV